MLLCLVVAYAMTLYEQNLYNVCYPTTRQGHHVNANNREDEASVSRQLGSSFPRNVSHFSGLINLIPLL